MKLLELKYPLSGAIHFRRLKGSVRVVDVPEGNALLVHLDPENTVPGNSKRVQHRGKQLHLKPEEGPFHELQIFSTPELRATKTIITDNDILDSRGRSLRNETQRGSEGLKFEINCSAVGDGPNIFLGWMVSKRGKGKLRFLTDGKLAKEIKFDAVEVPDDEIEEVRSMGDLVMNTYLGDPPEQVRIGEVITWGFSLASLENVKKLELDS